MPQGTIDNNYAQLYRSEITDPHLSDRDFRLYSFLKVCRNAQNESWWSISAIALSLKWGRATVARALHALVDKKYLRRKGRLGFSSITCLNSMLKYEQGVCSNMSRGYAQKRAGGMLKNETVSTLREVSKRSKSTPPSRKAGGSAPTPPPVRKKPKDAMSMCDVMKRLSQAVPALSRSTK